MRRSVDRFMRMRLSRHSRSHCPPLPPGALASHVHHLRGHRPWLPSHRHRQTRRRHLLRLPPRQGGVRRLRVPGRAPLVGQAPGLPRRAWAPATSLHQRHVLAPWPGHPLRGNGAARQPYRVYCGLAQGLNSRRMLLHKTTRLNHSHTLRSRLRPTYARHRASVRAHRRIFGARKALDPSLPE